MPTLVQPASSTSPRHAAITRAIRPPRKPAFREERGGSSSFFGSSAVRSPLTRGFAPQPHGWFAFVGKRSSTCEKRQKPCPTRRKVGRPAGDQSRRGWERREFSRF